MGDALETAEKVVKIGLGVAAGVAAGAIGYAGYKHATRSDKGPELNESAGATVDNLAQYSVRTATVRKAEDKAFQEKKDELKRLVAERKALAVEVGI